MQCSSRNEFAGLPNITASGRLRMLASGDDAVPGACSRPNLCGRGTYFSGLVPAYFLAFAAFIYMPVAWGAEPCGSPRITEPAGDVIGERAPEIRWTEVSGAEYYRVRVESRVPEGRTLVSLDAQVSTARFKPPQPLAEHRASVRVTVTAHCPGGSTSSDEQQGRFRIDTSPRCVLNGPISAVSKAGDLDLTWQAPEGALAYTVALYTPESGILIGQFDARVPHLRMRLPVAGRVGVAIQPQCRSGKGQPRFTVASTSASR